MNKFIMTAAAACLALGSAAQAATITTDTVVPSYTGLLAAPTSSSADFRLNFVGTDLVAPAPNSRDPWEGTEFAGEGYYNSVEANGFAEYTFETEQTSFSLMWGSPDSYNILSFFDGSGASVFSMNGVNPIILATAGYEASRKFVNVTVSGLTSFTTVRFESTGADAFEYANVSPVPLPAAGWMLIAGLGGLGAIGRRRRRKAA